MRKLLTLGLLVLSGAARAQDGDPYSAARNLLTPADEIVQALESAQTYLSAEHPDDARALATQALWRARARAASGDDAPGAPRRGLFKDTGAYQSPFALDALLALSPSELESLGRAATGALGRWRATTDLGWDQAQFAEAQGQVSLLLGDVERERVARAFREAADAGKAGWQRRHDDKVAARGWVINLVDAGQFRAAVSAFEEVVAASGCQSFDRASADRVERALELVDGKSAVHERCTREVLGNRSRAGVIEPHAVLTLPPSLTDDLLTRPQLVRYLTLAAAALVRQPRERALYRYLLALRCVAATARGQAEGCDADAQSAQWAAPTPLEKTNSWVSVRGALLRARWLRDGGHYEDALDAVRAARRLVTDKKAGPALAAEAAVDEGNALVLMNDVEGAAQPYADASAAAAALRADPTAHHEERARSIEAAIGGNRALLTYARLRLEAARGDELDSDGFEQARADLEAARTSFAALPAGPDRQAQLGAVGLHSATLQLLGARAFGDAARRHTALEAARVALVETAAFGLTTPQHAAALGADRCEQQRLAATATPKDKRAWKAARSTCDAAVKAALTVGVEDYRFRALYQRALVRGAQGDKKGAAEDLEAAALTVENLRSSVGDPARRQAFLYDKDDFYADAVRWLALEAHEPARALRFAERWRSRHFLELVSRSRALRRKSLDGGQLARQQVLDQPEALALGPHQFVVSYVLGRDFALALVLTPAHTVVAVPLGVARKAIDAAADRWRAEVMGLLSGLTVAKLASADSDGRIPWQDRLAELHDLVWRAVDDRVLGPACKDLAPGTCEVIVVGQGLLHHVPFAALVRDKDPAGGLWPRPRYVLDRYAISYAPSVSSLGQLVVGEPPPERSLVVSYSGDDLPAVRREVDQIKGVLPEVQELFGSSPRPQLVEQLTRRPVVVIAAHGELNPREPMESRLILAPQGQGEPVTLADLLQLHLDGESVYLSACETAQVEPWLVQGDDYVSLARAFLSAGATSVVATLWRLVDTAGAAVSTRYFAALYEGKKRSSTSRTQALRQAMLAAIDYRHTDGTPLGRAPLFWAPFALNGDPR